MNIKHLVFLAAMGCCATMTAQDNLKIVLKSGSELVGFVSSQRPGERITVKTHSGQFYIDSKDVKSIESNKYNVKELSSKWQEWAKEHRALIQEGNEKFLKLSTIYTKHHTFNKVRVLEQGVKVKYLSFSENEFSLAWDTIAAIKAKLRSNLMLSGINRRYKLRSGMEYEGQYVEEIPGKTLSLYQENGMIQVLRREDVLKDIRYKINPNQSLFEQSDLIDIVQLTNGTTYRGIIVERNYTPTDSISNDYLLVQSQDGVIQSVQLKDIREYRKEYNPFYKPQTDVVLKEGEIMLNRVPVKLYPAKEKNQVIYVASDSIKMAATLGDSILNIVIESKLPDVTLSSQIKLVKVNTYGTKTTKRKRSKKQQQVLYGFTYENLVNDQILPKKVETSINGITRFEFDDLHKGIYAVYIPTEKKLFLFKIGK